jgi:hypothetical protein
VVTLDGKCHAVRLINHEIKGVFPPMLVRLRTKTPDQWNRRFSLPLR